MDLQRQKNIFDPSQYPAHNVWIIGCGNIGSNVAVALVRMGIKNMVLFDGDDVEEVNLSTQHYLEEHLRYPKVVAIGSQLNTLDISGTYVAIDSYVMGSETFKKPNVGLPDIIISGVDSLVARRIVREAIIGFNNDVANNVPVIDGRMGKQQVEVHTFKNAYEWEIPGDDDNIMEADCTEKFIIYTPLMCAALISDSVKKIISGEKPIRSHIYDFKTNVMCVDRS